MCLRGRSGREDLGHPHRLELGHVAVRDDAAAEHRDVGRVALPQQLQNLGEQRHVRAREHGQPDGVRVLLDGRLDDLLGRLVQAGVDDLDAGVAQRAGHDLRPAVVPVEAGFGDHDADRRVHHAAQRNDRRHLGVRGLFSGAGGRRLLSGRSISAPSIVSMATRESGDSSARATRQGRGTTARRGARSLFSATGLRGAAIEVAWVAAHAALYPLGAVSERARPDAPTTSARSPPVQRGLLIGDIEAAGTPILLVHGMVDNRSIFTVLRRSLQRRGFGRVLSLNYSPADQATSAGRRAALGPGRGHLRRHRLSNAST